MPHLVLQQIIIVAYQVPSLESLLLILWHHHTMYWFPWTWQLLYMFQCFLPLHIFFSSHFTTTSCHAPTPSQILIHHFMIEMCIISILNLHFNFLISWYHCFVVLLSHQLLLQCFLLLCIFVSSHFITASNHAPIYGLLWKVQHNFRHKRPA